MDKQAKATNWSVTINNPTKHDDEYIALARQKGWKVEGQFERGEGGTPHYQLLVTSKGQQRFPAMKKTFPRAHIEVCRDVVALRKYVTKEETRVGSLPQEQELYPSLQKIWDMFYDWLNLDQNFKEYCSVGPDARLVMFDRYIAEKITEGYVVETMAVNPQIRSCVKLYGREIAIRSRTRRQTDRQTTENIISPSIITTNGVYTDEQKSEEQGFQTETQTSDDSSTHSSDDESDNDSA